MKHILLISLGPIQDFIASARQCQDLWFGSWLLSELAADVAHNLKNKSETLIFPADIDENKQQQGIANKIMAIVDETSENISVFMKNIHIKMQQRLLQLAQKAFDKIKPVKEHHFFREVANKQIEDLIEFMWVAVPISQSYQESRLQAEKLLVARKNSKNWTQPLWDRGTGIPKSSIDGIRESIFHEEIYPQRKSQRNNNTSGLSLEDRRKRYFIKDTERLCGVGLLKRVGTDSNHDNLFEWGKKGRPLFHSSSHMAGVKLLSQWTPQTTKLFDLYIKQLQEANCDVNRFIIHISGNIEFQNSFSIQDFMHEKPISSLRMIEHNEKYYDTSILFPTRLEALIKEQNITQTQQNLTNSLRNVLQNLGTQEPYPYYVMLLADGDKMGKAIHLLAKEGFEKHKLVSSALEIFTQESRKITEMHGGSLIYSGGDDVLALLPLHTALQCASELKDAFSRCLEQIFKDYSSEDKPTLSVGLAVCHHLQPMNQVRALAKEAEKLAKLERNSLAIIFKKRGGSAISISEQWNTKILEKNLIQRIWYWTKLFRDEIIPHKTAFVLEEVISPLCINWDKMNINEQKNVQQVCSSLATMVLNRRQIQDSSWISGDDCIANLKAYFSTNINPKEAIQKLSIELQIAREMLCVYKEVVTSNTQYTNI